MLTNSNPGQNSVEKDNDPLLQLVYILHSFFGIFCFVSFCFIKESNSFDLEKYSSI